MEKQSKELKLEIESHKEIIDETLANEELSNEEKIDFCNAIVKYLEDEKIGIEDFLEENKEEN